MKKGKIGKVLLFACFAFGAMHTNESEAAQPAYTVTVSGNAVECHETSRIAQGITTGMKVSDLQVSAGYVVKVYGTDNKTLLDSGDILKTGDILSVTDQNGRNDKRYAISVKGDVSGDGNMDVMDMEGIQKSVLGVKPLKQINLVAGILDPAKKVVSVIDMEKIQKDIL